MCGCNGDHKCQAHIKREEGLRETFRAQLRRMLVIFKKDDESAFPLQQSQRDFLATSISERVESLSMLGYRQHALDLLNAFGFTTAGA